MDRNIAELDKFIGRLEGENNRYFKAARQRGNARRSPAPNQEN